MPFVWISSLYLTCPWQILRDTSWWLWNVIAKLLSEVLSFLSWAGKLISGRSLWFKGISLPDACSCRYDIHVVVFWFLVLECMSHSLLKSKMDNKVKCKLTPVLVLAKSCVLGGERAKLMLDEKCKKRMCIGIWSASFTIFLYLRLFLSLFFFIEIFWTEIHFLNLIQVSI